MFAQARVWISLTTCCQSCLFLDGQEVGVLQVVLFKGFWTTTSVETTFDFCAGLNIERLFDQMNPRLSGFAINQNKCTVVQSCVISRMYKFFDVKNTVSSTFPSPGSSIASPEKSSKKRRTDIENYATNQINMRKPSSKLWIPLVEQSAKMFGTKLGT